MSRVQFLRLESALRAASEPELAWNTEQMTWEVRGYQDSVGMTLANILNSGEMELEEITSSR